LNNHAVDSNPLATSPSTLNGNLMVKLPNATTVRGPRETRETVEKETADQPPPPERRLVG